MKAVGDGVDGGSGTAVLTELQRLFSAQMAAQMDSLVDRVGAILLPTAERLNRLERAVEKLADVVQTDAGLR